METPGTRSRMDPEWSGRHCGRVIDHGDAAWNGVKRNRWEVALLRSAAQLPPVTILG